MLRLRTQFPCVYSKEGSSGPPSSPSQACLALHTRTVFPWEMHGLQSTQSALHLAWGFSSVSSFSAAPGSWVGMGAEAGTVLAPGRL